MEEGINGSCICGLVEFAIIDDFKAFKLCHCKFCQKSSGSAYVSNAFASPEAIRWVKGTDRISTYDVPNSQVRKVFCNECGTTLPFTTQNEKYLVVPVGSLSKQPLILPQEVKNWIERMPWYDHVHALELIGN